MSRVLRVLVATLGLYLLFGLILQAVAHLLAGNLFAGEWFLAIHPESADGADWVPSLALLGFAALQSCLVFGTVPTASGSDVSSAPLMPRLIGAALLCSLPFALLGLAVIDLSVFKPEAVRRAFQPQHWVLGILVAWVVSWVIWVPFLLHRSKAAPDSLERAVGKGIAGSAVALGLTLPWYFVVRTKERCFCGLGSYAALVLGLFALLVVGGPLLLVFARDRRIRAALRQG